MSIKTQCECGDEKIMLVEYGYPSPNHYDGISEYKCLECGNRVGRWSGKLLAKNEEEKRYGG